MLKVLWLRDKKIIIGNGWKEGMDDEGKEFMLQSFALSDASHCSLFANHLLIRNTSEDI